MVLGMEVSSSVFCFGKITLGNSELAPQKEKECEIEFSLQVPFKQPLEAGKQAGQEEGMRACRGAGEGGWDLVWLC